MTLPAEKMIQVNFTDGKLWLSALDLKHIGFTEGDDIVASVIDGVVMVGTRKNIGEKILESFRKGFEEDGVTLEELIEEGQRVRQELYDETYGSEAK